MWEDLSIEFKVLLIASEILVSLLAIWGVFKFFKKFKSDEEKHNAEIREWKNEK